MLRTRLIHPALSALIVAVAGTAMFLVVPRPAHALTIVPPSFDFTINPGDTVSDVVRVYNEGDLTITIKPEVFNLTTDDEVEGAPVFYPADEDRNGYGLAQWITFPTEEVVLKPKMLHNFSFTINTPENAQPGGHYGAFQMKVFIGGEEEVRPEIPVGLVGGTAVIVLVRVEGDVSEELNVTQFSGDQATYAHLPVDLHIRLENKGTVHLRPTGNIFITDMFGKQVGVLGVNSEFRSILPDTARRFEASWSKGRYQEMDSEWARQMKNFAFGKYTATLVLNYGTEGRHVMVDYTFWVLPWLALMTWAGILIGLLVVFFFGLKGYNKMIIRKFQSSMSKQKKE